MYELPAMGAYHGQEIVVNGNKFRWHEGRLAWVKL